ncbi:MAG TPA: hypothetical protein V6D17_25250 [Candidatus Obscuribacterales bacterium]
MKNKTCPGLISGILGGLFLASSASILFVALFNLGLLLSTNITMAGFVHNSLVIAALSLGAMFYGYLGFACLRGKSFAVDYSRPEARFVIRHARALLIAALLIPTPFFLISRDILANRYLPSSCCLAQWRAKQALRIESFLFGEPVSLAYARENARSLVRKKKYKLAETFIRFRLDHYRHCPLHPLAKAQVIQQLGAVCDFQGKTAEADALYRELAAMGISPPRIKR